MTITRRYIKLISAVTLLTVLLTWFFYAHETFPKPLRAATALVGTPVAIASGLSYYLKLGIPVYDTPWAVVLSNLTFSALLVFLADKFFNKRNKDK
ncbi:MAG: hypothetical protein EPN85_13015 [Bacteroidetes bacterium]|nr:MAG: hypothetical protein EPN85_13015 [Bacteroidota bacterium]